MSNGKTRKTLSLLLVLLLLLSLAGCAASGNNDATEPNPTDSAPVVGADLPEWLPEEFALLEAKEDGEAFYHYTGAERDVDFPFYDMTLHLLPEWDNLVDVLIRETLTGERVVYVVNRELMQEHQRLHPEKGASYGIFDPVLRVMAGEDVERYVNSGHSVCAYLMYYSMECNESPWNHELYGNTGDWLAQEKEAANKEIEALRVALASGDREYDTIRAETLCNSEQLYNEVVEIHQVTKPQWLPDNFELSGVQPGGRRGYRYTGTDTEIPMEELGVTLHLPQEWAGQVEVFICTYYGDECGIYVVNKELAEAHLEAMEKHYELDQYWLTYYDYLLRLSVTPDDDRPEPVALDEYTGAEYLGTNGTWRYVVHSNEKPETVSYMNSDMALNEALIYEIGQEAYDNLRQKMVCTHEQALEIVEMHDVQ